MDQPPVADASLPGVVADASLLGVLLTGGTGERLGGADKAALVADGRTLLERGLDALSAAAATVVVGPEVATSSDRVSFVREEPAGAGPAAGLLAGLDVGLARTGAAEWVAVLAVDMPWVTDATVARLLAAALEAGSDGAVLVGPDGRRQLCAVLGLAPLKAVRPDDATGLGFFRLLRDLELVDVPAEGREAVDVDTPDDLAALALPPEDGAAVAATPGSDEAVPVNELDAWIADLSAALGADATFGAASGEEPFDKKTLLDLTRVVAHDVVRPAAPLTLFVLGLVAGRTNAGPAELASLVAQVEALVASRGDGDASS